MAEIVDYISIYNVIEDYLDFSNDSSYDEGLILKLADDAAQKIIPPNQLSHKVTLDQLTNWKCKVPNGCKSIVQIAYRKKRKSLRNQKGELVQWVQRSAGGEGCDITISKNCPRCSKPQDNCECSTQEVIIDVDEIWRRSHPQYFYGQSKFLYGYGGIGNSTNQIPSSVYNPEFEVMRAATHNFHAADYHIPGCLNLNDKLLANQTAQYSIDDGVIISNIQECDILISYLGVKMDDEGWHLIPNDPDVFEAINWFVESRILYREWKDNMNNGTIYTAHKDAKAEFRRYLGMAREKLETPGFDEWMTFLDNHWRRLIPRGNPQEEMNRFREDQYDPPNDSYQ